MGIAFSLTLWCNVDSEELESTLAEEKADPGMYKPTAVKAMRLVAQARKARAMGYSVVAEAIEAEAFAYLCAA
jgi:hypothetical protein